MNQSYLLLAGHVTNIILFGRQMYFQPKVGSPSGSTSILLKNSRLSDRSTEGDRSFKVNRSFDFDSSFISSPANKLSVISHTPAQLQQFSGPIQAPQESAASQVKRNYLTKVLIARMLAVRNALKKMQSLPLKMFKKTESFALAKEIVMRCKPNIEMSVLRTLLYAEQKRNKQESKLQYSSGRNIFVLATPSKREESKRSLKLLLDLSEMAKDRMRDGLKALKAHGKRQQVISQYFEKICAKFEQRRADAFLTIRQYPFISATAKTSRQLLHSQLKLATFMMEKKYHDLIKSSFATIHANSEEMGIRQEAAARQIIAFSRLRKQDCLRKWLHIAKTSKRTLAIATRVEEDKVTALSRIVQRNYLKLFIEITRRLRIFQIAAYRIGCCSKINEQKSLWRLLAHMQEKLRLEREIDQEQP